MKKKLFALLVSLIAVMFVFTGCGDKELNMKLSFVYYGPDEPVGAGLVDSVSERDYNHSLFYRNELTSHGADPSAIYVTEGDEKGYFYMYATSDEIGVSGYQCWRSKDLVNWECRGVAFVPDRNCWALTNYWAPEVIYDEDDKTYYMYYNADNLSNGGVKCMGLATSKTPYGPFVQYTNPDKGITLTTPLFDFTKMADDDPLTEKDGNRKRAMKVIDACPFKDDDGQKYMYFCHDLGDGGDCNGYSQSSIYVIKMTDWYTPDYTQVRKLTHPNKITTENVIMDTSPTSALLEGDVNEGPYMYKYNGKYYLTYSANNYEQKAYSVRVAVSDKPMGPFTKLTREEGGWLLSAESHWDHASGSGHHSFAQAGDELFIIYHAHVDRLIGSGQRAIAGDRVLFTKNAAGLDVPYANGPTYSLQPLAAEVSGYKNIAGKATVTATNTAEGSDVALLTDGLVKYHDYLVEEYRANAGKSVITLTFDDYVPTRAVMIFNSYNFNDAIGRISNIEFEYKAPGAYGIAHTGPLLFDWTSYCTMSNTMRPGGSFTVEYAEMLTKSIKITINNGDAPFALSDIVVLGK